MISANFWLICHTADRLLLFSPHQNGYVRGAFNKFPDFFVQAFKIVVDS